MLKILCLFAGVFLAVSTTAASAHAVTDDTQSSELIRLLESIIICLTVIAYAVGLMRIRRKVGPDRVIRRSQSASFATALVLFVIILSPEIDEITDALFSAHMAQHLVLMLLIPPLLVWSRPSLVMSWVLPPRTRKILLVSSAVHRLRSAARPLLHPLTVAILFLGTFSFWHLPRPYAWSLQNEWVHTFEHLSFLATAFMFWTLVIEPSGRRRMPLFYTVVFVAGIAVISGLPGALMILSPVVLFKAHGTSAYLWGFTPLEDQQLAGLIMWIPAGLIFLAPIAWLFVKSVQLSEKRGAVIHACSSAMLLILIPGFLSGCSLSKAGPEDGSAHAKELIAQYGCGTCHAIPGVADANGRVGPPLGDIGNRIFIAGRLQNTVDNMVTWISTPQAVDPGNAMPDMGISAKDARAIALYLETLRPE